VTTDTVSKTTTTSTVMKTSVSRTIRSIPNPKLDQLQPIDNQLRLLNLQRTDKENMLLSLTAVLQKDVGSKMGFLDELRIMFNLLKASTIAAVVYVIWLAFLLLLELLILIGKANEAESDYDKTIHKQMSIHFRKIDLL